MKHCSCHAKNIYKCGRVYDPSYKYFLFLSRHIKFTVILSAHKNSKEIHEYTHVEMHTYRGVFRIS